MQNVFEISKDERLLADTGRAMMDFSEDYGKIHGLGHLAEEGFRVLNELSHVGGMLTRYGNTFGTNKKSFSDDHKQLIAKFLKKELDIPSK